MQNLFDMEAKAMTFVQMPFFFFLVLTIFVAVFSYQNHVASSYFARQTNSMVLISLSSSLKILMFKSKYQLRMNLEDIWANS